MPGFVILSVIVFIVLLVIISNIKVVPQAHADGKATKIIIPSDIQSLAGNVTAIKELRKE